MKKLFVIEDKFEIEGKGIALIGVPDDDAKKLEKGDVIIIKQGDALAVGQIDINHHNIDIVFPKTAQRLCAVVDTQHDNAEGL